MSDPIYQDDDLVYVDTQKRVVVGKVEWGKDGKPLKKQVVDEADSKAEKGYRRRKSYYPWGTYKTMKKLYRIEGKEKEVEVHLPLDEVMEKALKEPYWEQGEG